MTTGLVRVTNDDMSELAETNGPEQVKTTSVALSPHDIDMLGRIARHLGRSRSDVMRLLVRRYAPVLLQGPGLS